MEDKHRPLLTAVFSPSGLAGLAIIMIVSAFFFVPGLGLESRDTIILIGILFAITGWLFTSAVNIHNRIKQHTFDLIIRTRFDESYKNSTSLLRTSFSSSTLISKSDASLILAAVEGENKKLRNAIGDVLNFYEVLAISIWYRDANEEILKEYYKDILVGHVKKAFNIFPLWRSTDKEAFIYVEWLYNRWKSELAT